MKKILCLALVVLTLCSVCFFSAFAVGTNGYLYENVFIEYLRYHAHGHDVSDNWYRYKEICYYYGEDRSMRVVPDSNVAPDYALVMAKINYAPQSGSEVLGDYVLEYDNIYGPYILGYYIYTPSNGEIHTLSHAVTEGFADIDRVFTEEHIPNRLIGDVDKDRKITIKDATHIQKCLAGIMEFASDDILDGLFVPDLTKGELYMPFYISDFNRDGERSIKDATAIQKHLAGLEY